MRIVPVMIVFVLLCSTALARDVPTVAEFLPTVTADNTLAILGDKSDDADAFFSINSLIFKGDVKSYVQWHPNTDQYIGKRNVIVVGGPCVNSRWWTTFSEETCENWPYPPGQSVMKLVNYQGTNVLLIAGTTKQDTLQLAERLGSNPKHSEFTKHKIIFESPSDGRYVSQCEKAGDYCTQLDLGFEIPFKIGNDKLTLKLGEIYPEKSSIALWVDGTRTVLERGKTVKKKFVELTYDNVVFDEEGQPRAILLRTTTPLSAEFDTVTVTKSSGSVKLDQGRLTYLKFTNDERVVRLRAIIADESRQRAELDVNGVPVSLDGGESVTAEGINMTLQFVSKPLNGPTEVLLYYKK